MTFAEHVIRFYRALEFTGKLPKGIEVMNPYRDNPRILEIAEKFYGKFYNDRHIRRIILGINPGRLGAGATGIAFTDTKRLRDKCGIDLEEFSTHEPSSVFIYEMIDAFGGVEAFYHAFYITSICPLGFVSTQKGSVRNYNYYDSKALEKSITPFALGCLRTQLEFGIDTRIAYCLGTGKNYQFIQKLNEEYKFFDEVVPLEHPRYIMQYKSKSKDIYIDKYLTELSR
ncbi:MAG TPA: uracil-DNA glycosylase family protein [Flavobacteriales bacterium]